MTNQVFDAAEYARKDFLERIGEGDNAPARMFYAGEVPWHGLGQTVGAAVTSKQALELAGLANWDIHLERMRGENHDDIYADDWMTIVRGMDGRVLGAATKAYKPIQNEEGFDFLDSLVKDHVMRYETAGSLMGGRRVWVLAKMEDDMEVLGDKHAQYLLLVMGHDNYFSFKVYTTDVTVVCNNTLMAATRRNQHAVRIVHSGNTQDKFERARRTLAATTATSRALNEWMVKLAKKKVTEDQVTLFREGLFGVNDDETPTRRKNRIEQFMSVYMAEQERVGRTGYAMLQAVTGFADHLLDVRERNDGNQKLMSAIQGTGLVFKQDGVALIQKLTRIQAPEGMATPERKGKGKDVATDTGGAPDA